MHELSIALGLLDQARAEAERQGGRLVGIRIRVGPLAGVDADALRSAFELATDTIAPTRIPLEIERSPLTGECPKCGEQIIEAMHSLLCGICRTPVVRICQGRELDLMAIELETEA